MNEEHNAQNLRANSSCSGTDMWLITSYVGQSGSADISRSMSSVCGKFPSNTCISQSTFSYRLERRSFAKRKQHLSFGDSFDKKAREIRRFSNIILYTAKSGVSPSLVGKKGDGLAFVFFVWKYRDLYTDMLWRRLSNDNFPLQKKA